MFTQAVGKLDVDTIWWRRKVCPAAQTPKTASNKLGVLAVYGLQHFLRYMVCYMVRGCPTNTLFYV